MRKDIGLSEGYQTALGEAMAAYATDLPKTATGFVLVTHSRAMIRPFLPLNPTFLRVGDDLRPTREWLEKGDLPRSFADLESLRSKAHKRYLAVRDALTEA